MENLIDLILSYANVTAVLSVLEAFVLPHVPTVLGAVVGYYFIRLLSDAVNATVWEQAGNASVLAFILLSAGAVALAFLFLPILAWGVLLGVLIELYWGYESLLDDRRGYTGGGIIIS